MISRFAPAFGLAMAAAISASLAPTSLRAQGFTAPTGYIVRAVLTTNAGIGGFDVADDGSIIMILGTGGYGSPASSLVRWDPFANAFATLHAFPDSAYGSFVEVVGSNIFFGQSAAYPDTTSETNRIMSVRLDGSGLTTNLLLQNYAAAQDAQGRLFFTGNPDSNAVFLVSGVATNRLIEMPTYSGGLAFATNGDIYVAQTTPLFQNNMFRFTPPQVSNAIATGMPLLPSDGIQVATNIAGSSYLAADSDRHIFFPDFGDMFDVPPVPGKLYALDLGTGTTTTFGAVTGGFAVVSSMQFRPGLGIFETNAYSAGTLYALLTDYGSFNQLIAIGVPNSRASWNAHHFTEAERQDEGISGFFADPEGDGGPNGLEYAFCGDPKRPDLPGTVEPSTSEGRLTLTFTRDPQNGDLDYVVETSGTLRPNDWQEIVRFSGNASVSGTNHITESLAGDKVRVTVTDPDTGGARFMRVRAELIQP